MKKKSRDRESLFSSLGLFFSCCGREIRCCCGCCYNPYAEHDVDTSNKNLANYSTGEPNHHPYNIDL